ncbi:MAG: BrnT family toxin [Devosia nanyangense]|nr:BrnT family toxin [Devosia nanyangense]
MRFEWDEDKFQSNVRKHGVSFDLATQALLDPFLLEEPERDTWGRSAGA